MKKRRKITTPREYIAKKKLGKNLTRQRVGRLHADMRAEGYVSSSPVNAPKEHSRVWVSRHDPWALPVILAEREESVPKSKVAELLGSPGKNGLPIQQLNDLGIAAVPQGPDDVKLVGTCPVFARLANRAHHGKKRRTITDKEIIRMYKNRPRGSRSRRPGDGKLQECLIWFSNRFKLDLSDLIGHGSMLL